ncbi:MAG: hypothetical protein KDB07_04425, partial [Planctomycetes bacterium]|nr:hypothetical protein [Planctomycetota bacterium]
MRRIRRSPRRRARRGISLIEIVIAFMLLSLVLVEMRRIGIESMTAFDHSRNNLSGVWMANMIMNELISSELPNFDLELEGEGEAGLVEGRGGVGDFISEHFPEMWASMSEQRQEMLNEWGYHYSKMVFMISEDEQGGPDGAFAPYLDAEDFDEPTDDELEDPDYINPDDRLQKPTARVIRVMLVVTPPRGEGEDAEIPSLVDVPIFGGE